MQTFVCGRQQQRVSLERGKLEKLASVYYNNLLKPKSKSEDKQYKNVVMKTKIM